MDPSQYGNLKWVGQYEKIEAKASSNLAFCMQNLLREAHKIPSRDELKSSRVRLEKRLAEQKAREHERLYEEWMRQNDARMYALEQEHLTLTCADPSSDGLVAGDAVHTPSGSNPEQKPLSMLHPQISPSSACTDSVVP